ncbi:hypothetical protein C8Q80DRAFT_1119576 [Daedaleopsis nitida]|nr:hypothetical protein C8Q80DRAFT_1119576 [Daedaleopsis nitida]
MSLIPIPPTIDMLIAVLYYPRAFEDIMIFTRPPSHLDAAFADMEPSPKAMDLIIKNPATRVNVDPGLHFWAQVPVIAPRLRYLDLKIILNGLNDAHADSLDNMPGALRSLPLVCLRLYLPKLSLIDQCRSWDDPWEARYNPQHPANAIVQRMYPAHLVTMQSLPIRFASAIPTLKLSPNCIRNGVEPEGDTHHTVDDIESADAEYAMELEEDNLTGDTSDQQFGEGISVPEAAEIENSYDDKEFFDEQYDHARRGKWYQEKVVRSQWWRVVDAGDDGGWYVQELTAEQGARAQKLLDDSNIDWLEQMDVSSDGSIVDDRWTSLGLRHAPPDQEFFDERDDYVCEGGWY